MSPAKLSSNVEISNILNRNHLKNIFAISILLSKISTALAAQSNLYERHQSLTYKPHFPEKSFIPPSNHQLPGICFGISQLCLHNTSSCFDALGNSKIPDELYKKILTFQDDQYLVGTYFPFKAPVSLLKIDELLENGFNGLLIGSITNFENESEVHAENRHAIAVISNPIKRKSLVIDINQIDQISNCYDSDRSCSFEKAKQVIFTAFFRGQSNKESQKNVLLHKRLYALSKTSFMTENNPEFLDLSQESILWNIIFGNIEILSQPFILQLLHDSPYPLICESIRAEQYQMAHALISLGIKIKDIDHQGNNPFHIAASKGNIPLLQRLIRMGVFVDQVNKDGNTALILATFERRTNAMQFLLSKSADLNLVNLQGKKALDVANKRSCRECLTILKASNQVNKN